MIDWIKERLAEPSTLIVIAVLIYAYSRVSGVDTQTIVDWIQDAVSDIGLLVATLVALVAAAKKG